jgi:hypothetical protein
VTQQTRAVAPAFAKSEECSRAKHAPCKLKECDPLSFAVTGKFTHEGKRMTLNGKAPRIGRNCKITGDRKEEIVFDFFK